LGNIKAKIPNNTGGEMRIICEDNAITILSESKFEEVYLKSFPQTQLFEDGWGIQIEKEEIK